MKQETLIAGFGGQGILLIGQLLAEAAMRQGLHATWFPSYGPEMRGGTANCTTIYADDEIGSPIASHYDNVIVMNQPSLERFGPRVRPGGTLLVNATMVPIRAERDDIVVSYVPTGELATESGGEKFSNVVMLGVFLALRPELRHECVADAIRGLIGKKRPELIDPNLRALALGREHGAGSAAVAGA